MADPTIQYWDSCVLIAYIREEQGREATVEQLLHHLDGGKFRLFMSTLALAEIRPWKVPATGAAYNPDRQQEIDDLLQSERVSYIPVTEHIAREAQTIGWQHPDLAPNDCIHIATAIDVAAHTLFTYDGDNKSGTRYPDRMLSYDAQIGSPPLTIEVPYNPWPTLGL